MDKRVENRTWEMPFYLRGEWIALHAAKALDKEAFVAIDEILERKLGLVCDEMCKQCLDNLTLPRGQIVAVARFGRVWPNYGTPERPDWARDKWFFGPVGWEILQVHKLREPIPYKGMLGFWRIKDRQVVGTISEQLALAGLVEVQGTQQYSAGTKVGNAIVI
jgi:hypothetical protein